MLQELTENDFDYINKSLSTKNLLIVYNIMKELGQKNIMTNLNNYYFDDKFYWDWPSTKVAQKRKNEMIWGYEIYGGVFDIKGSVEKYFPMIKTALKDKGVQFENDSLWRYIRTIFNKLRPEDEFFKNYLLKDWIEKKKEQEEKIKYQEQLRQDAKTQEEKELEEYQAYENDKIANEKIKDKIKSNTFIYGIYIDGELCYIGKTIRQLKERLGEHLEWSLLENGGGTQQNYLYKAMRECQIGYKFKILYESHNVINNHDLEQIEKTLIENLQPKFNYEGVKVPYRFSKDK